MALPDEYERQERWRRFGDALAHVPLVRGQRVLDLGCGVGTATALLAKAGADVVGVDVDDALLQRAREHHPGLRFEKHDVRALDGSTFGRVDGIWSSFVAAYFADLPAFVTRLRELVVDDGWVALVEIDDLLGHEPRPPALAADIAGFYAWARANGGYGFVHGHVLAPALRDAGFELVHEGTLDDGEARVSRAGADRGAGCVAPPLRAHGRHAAVFRRALRRGEQRNPRCASVIVTSLVVSRRLRRRTPLSRIARIACAAMHNEHSGFVTVTVGVALVLRGAPTVELACPVPCCGRPNRRPSPRSKSAREPRDG